MSEDVVYTDVKFNKKGAKHNEAQSPDQNDVTYSEVRKGKSKTDASSLQINDATYETINIALTSEKTRGTSSNREEEVIYSDVQRGPKPKTPSQGTSNVTKRVIIGILIAVLVLAVIAVVTVISLHMFFATTPNMTATTTNTTNTTTTMASATTTSMASPTVTTTASITTTTATTESTTTSPVPCTHVCDSDWELNGTKCYHFSTNELSWKESKKACEKSDGNLVKIVSTEEQKFLYSKLVPLMEDAEDKFWIGLTDSESEDKWKWTDGSSLDPNVTFWFSSEKQKEPDNWTGESSEGEDCVRMGEEVDVSKPGAFETSCWFDKNCNSLQRYICEKHPTCGNEN